MDKETFEIVENIISIEEYDELKEILKKRKITQMNFPAPLKRTSAHNEFVSLTKKLDENLKHFVKGVDEDNNSAYVHN